MKNILNYFIHKQNPNFKCSETQSFLQTKFTKNWSFKPRRKKPSYERNLFYLDSLTFTIAIQHNTDTEIHKQEVNKILEQNIILPSISLWSSPIWVVPKILKANRIQKWRVVIDYSKLNKVTVVDEYPLPNLLNHLGR